MKDYFASHNSLLLLYSTSLTIYSSVELFLLAPPKDLSSVHERFEMGQGDCFFFFAVFKPMDDVRMAGWTMKRAATAACQILFFLGRKQGMFVEITTVCMETLSQWIIGKYNTFNQIYHKFRRTWLVITSPIWALIGQCACYAFNWTVKSWWRRLTAWRLFKTRQKKGKLISEHINKSDSRFAVARFCQSLPMITDRIGLLFVLVPLLILQVTHLYHSSSLNLLRLVILAFHFPGKNRYS